VVRYLKLGLAATLVYWLIQSNQLDFSAIKSVLFSWNQLMLGGVIVVWTGIQIVRWFLILKTQNIPINLLKTGQIFYIGQFFFMTSLGLAGSETARGYYISRYAGKKTVAAIATQLIDRVLGLHTFALVGSLAFLTLMWQGEPPSGVIEMGGVTLVLYLATLLFFLMIYQQNLRTVILSYLPVHWHQRIMGQYNLGRETLKKIPAIYGVSLLTNLGLMLAFKVASEILNTPVSWFYIFLITPLVVVANSLPISFGGLGVGEAAAQALMSQVGIENGASMMLLIRVSQWCITLPLGLTFYLAEGKIGQETTEQGIPTKKN
jgi:glycosyltransferase 2 family protein